MSDSTPPTRTAGDHIRRANIADASTGLDAYPAADWVRACGADVSETLRAWQSGQLAELPIGQAWDVVRLPCQEGWEVVRHMNTIESPLGPVLHTPAGVHIFVAVDAANDWDLPGVSVLGPGEVLLVPNPSVVAPHTQDSRTWIVAPRIEPHLADAADLYDAYASAIAAMGSSRGTR
ncbi:hypothetical protein ACIQGT_40440 [Streptomyces sp. NPDC093108]|uniref:hypothetical protein n=1 Tax=unclassified Streptomyces TaxID=2593676 RepID=UPI003826053C